MLYIKGGKFGALLTHSQAMPMSVQVATHVAEEMGYSLQITSGIDPDSGRSAASLHPLGDALDGKLGEVGHEDGVFTPRGDQLVYDEFRDKLKAALGDLFDVVAHDVGSGLHAHWEYQPGDGRLKRRG